MSLRATKDQLVSKIDHLITTIDTFIATKKSSEVLMITLAIPFLFLFLFHQYIIPMKEKETIRSKQEMIKVQNELAKYKQTGTEEVSILNEQVLELGAEIERVGEQKGYLEARFLELDSIYFDSKEWVGVLEKMTTEAEKRGVVIASNKNSIQKDGSGFMPIVEIDLMGHGQFLPLMNFLHTIEAGSKMITIEQLSLMLKQNRELEFETKLKLWEIR